MLSHIARCPILVLFALVMASSMYCAALPYGPNDAPGYGGDDGGYDGDGGYYSGDDGQGYGRGGYTPCSKAGFFGSAATCCATDINGAASLGCKPPARNPRSPKEFKDLCGARKPKCCFIDPVGGIINAVCPTPVGF